MYLKLVQITKLELLILNQSFVSGCSLVFYILLCGKELICGERPFREI